MAAVEILPPFGRPLRAPPRAPYSFPSRPLRALKIYSMQAPDCTHWGQPKCYGKSFFFWAQLTKQYSTESNSLRCGNLAPPPLPVLSIPCNCAG